MHATRLYTLRSNQLQGETIIALIGDFPFYAFKQNDNDVVEAYIRLEEDTKVVQAAVQQLSNRFDITVKSEDIEEENWNQRWESNYKPVEIGSFLRITAPFHEVKDGFKLNIELVPEMSFGTGHHATTFLMASLLEDYSLEGKSVFDFGTGTGILAIVAKQLGATKVIASDIDSRCIESTLENAKRNNTPLNQVYVGDENDFPDSNFDLILANINRSVLENSIHTLVKKLNIAGELWLSGILTTDLPIIQQICNQSGLLLMQKLEKDNWLACRYSLNKVS